MEMKVRLCIKNSVYFVMYINLGIVRSIELYIYQFVLCSSFKTTKLFYAIYAVLVINLFNLMPKYFLASLFGTPTGPDGHSTFVPGAPILAKHH